MAFQKKIWKGRKSEYPSCRKLIKADGSAELVTLARAEGQVTQEGDAFSPENMNGLEDRIEAGFAELKTVAPSETTPKAAGTAATGTEETFARGDHVHPKQTSVTGNAGTATKLATARTIDGVSFNGSAAITHYGTCSTAAATAAKVVACTGFTLVTGARITVKFTNTNTASNPTLNVNSTGAKAVYYRGAAITSRYLAANRTYEFVYNGTQYELVGDIDTNTTITRQSVTSSSKNIEIAPKSFAVYDFSFPFPLYGITILTFEMGWGASAYPRVFLGKSGDSSTLPVLFYNDTAGGMTLSSVTVTIHYTTSI